MCQLLVTEQVFITVEVTSLKEYGLRTNALMILHHTLTLASYEGAYATS